MFSLLSPISFAFGPFLLSCLLCGFPSSSVSSFLSPSSSFFPFPFFLLALSSSPVFIFLLPRFMLSFFLPPAALSFDCHYSLPRSVPSFPPDAEALSWLGGLEASSWALMLGGGVFLPDFGAQLLIYPN